MKTFLELAKNRFSARAYKQAPVPENDLNYVLEAGRIAPSAVNYQPWYFLVLTDPEKLTKVHALYHREWFRTAPVVILLLADHRASWKRGEDGKNHSDIDIAIAADHMTLAATDRGLATCWVCNFEKKKTIELFDLPEYIEPIVFLPLGYPVENSDPNRHIEKRKKLDKIVHREIFNKYLL
jgi:nitroreductase